MTIQLGWFSTGRGPGSYGMLSHFINSIESGGIDAQIQFVFSNREYGEGDGSDKFFDFVRSKNIPLVHYSFRKFQDDRGGRFEGYRSEYDARVIESLLPYNPAICLLAGYLLILSPVLCKSQIFLNLHPALPWGPKGLWKSVIWKIIREKQIETGATVFRVTNELDAGPTITLNRFPIVGPGFDKLWEGIDGKDIKDLVESIGEKLPLFGAIREAGMRREPYLLLETIKLLAEGELNILNDTIIPSVNNVDLPFDLTFRVESSVDTV